MEARYLTDDKGKRVSVLLDIKEYERLREGRSKTRWKISAATTCL